MHATVLTSCSGGSAYLALLAQWLYRVRRVSRITVTVATHDRQRDQLLKVTQLHSHCRLVFYGLGAHEQWDTRQWNTDPTVSRASQLIPLYYKWRMRVLIATLSVHSHVLLCDLDAIWFRDPTPFMLAPGFDLVFTPGISPLKMLRSYGFTLCMGAASFSSRTLGFLRALEARMLMGDQKAANDELQQLNPSWLSAAFPLTHTATLLAPCANGTDGRCGPVELKIAALAPDFACRDTCLEVVSLQASRQQVHIIHPWGVQGQPLGSSKLDVINALLLRANSSGNCTAPTIRTPHGHSQLNPASADHSVSGQKSDLVCSLPHAARTSPPLPVQSL